MREAGGLARTSGWCVISLSHGDHFSVSRTNENMQQKEEKKKCDAGTCLK